jgi:hypothetical protein
MAKIEIVAGGERGGKSRSAGEDLLPYAILEPSVFGRSEPYLHYGLVAQEFDHAREEFDYLLDGLSKLGMVKPGSVSKPDQGRWRLVTKSGTLVDTWSAKDPERIRRVFFHGALLCEPGLLTQGLHPCPGASVADRRLANGDRYLRGVGRVVSRILHDGSGRQHAGGRLVHDTDLGQHLHLPRRAR